MAKVRSQLLLVHDREDTVAPLADSRDLAETHTRIDQHATQGLGHRRILGNPAVVESAVRFPIGEQRQTAVAHTQR